MKNYERNRFCHIWAMTRNILLFNVICNKHILFIFTGLQCDSDSCTGVLISPQPDQEGNKLQRPNSNFRKTLKRKKIRNVVRPTRSPRQQRPPRLTKNGELSIVFFQSGRAKDLSAPLYIHFISIYYKFRNICLIFCFWSDTPSSGPGPPHLRGFYITHNDVPQSEGLLWTSDQPNTETSA